MGSRDRFHAIIDIDERLMESIHLALNMQAKWEKENGYNEDCQRMCDLHNTISRTLGQGYRISPDNLYPLAVLTGQDNGNRQSRSSGTVHKEI